MTDEEWEKTQAWLKGGAKASAPKPPAPPKPGAPAAAEDDDPGVVSQIATGLGRGLYSNVTGLETAVGNIPGLEGMKPAKQTLDWVNRPDRGGWETAARLGGEYAPLMIPGLDAPKGLGLLGKLAVNAVKGGIGGTAATGDKEGARAGAATATGSTLARSLGSAALSTLGSTKWGKAAQFLGDKAATVGSFMAAENLMKGQGRGGGTYVPYWYIGHSLPSALAALAAIALGAPAGAQGRAGAEMYKDWVGEGESDEGKQ